MKTLQVKPIIKFHKVYSILALVLLLIEVLIAKYATRFNRHTIGDYLWVMLLYILIKSFVKFSNCNTAIFVLLFAYGAEFIQLIYLQKMYPLEYLKIIKLLAGTSFSIGNLAAYTLGIVIGLVIEATISNAYKTH